jgi:hypothetical protein
MTVIMTMVLIGKKSSKFIKQFRGFAHLNQQEVVMPTQKMEILEEFI